MSTEYTKIVPVEAFAETPESRFNLISRLPSESKAFQALAVASYLKTNLESTGAQFDNNAEELSTWILACGFTCTVTLLAAGGYGVYRLLSSRGRTGPQPDDLGEYHKHPGYPDSNVLDRGNGDSRDIEEPKI